MTPRQGLRVPPSRLRVTSLRWASHILTSLATPRPRTPPRIRPGRPHCRRSATYRGTSRVQPYARRQITSANCPPRHFSPCLYRLFRFAPLRGIAPQTPDHSPILRLLNSWAPPPGDSTVRRRSSRGASRRPPSSPRYRWQPLAHNTPSASTFPHSRHPRTPSSSKRAGWPACVPPCPEPPSPPPGHPAAPPPWSPSQRPSARLCSSMLLASVPPCFACSAGCSTSTRHHRTQPSSRPPLPRLLPRLAASNSPPLCSSILAKPGAPPPTPPRSPPTPRTLPPAFRASPPRLHRTECHGAPFPCRRTSHAPPTPRPPTTSHPRPRSRTTTLFPSRSVANRGSLRATPHPVFHIQPRTRPPAALPAQPTGAPISFCLRLSPPPPPALSPAPTPHRPTISRNLRILLRPPRRLPPHPARRSWLVQASLRIPPLATPLQQATSAAPPLRPLLPAVRPPPRHLAVNPLHLWLRAPGRCLWRTASAREHAVALLRPPHLTHA